MRGLEADTRLTRELDHRTEQRDSAQHTETESAAGHVMKPKSTSKREELAEPTFERCPLPGCENPAGKGKTGACCGAHATALAARARMAASTLESNAAAKKRERAEEQRIRDRRARLEQALQEREARVVAAFRSHR